MTRSYQYCNYLLESDLSFPELPPSAAGSPKITFLLKPARPQLPAEAWTNQWSAPGGQVVLLHRRSGPLHYLRFLDGADFTLSPEAGMIECDPAPDATEDTLRHLLLDQVLPRVLAYQGQVMLHASAVLVEGRILLFIGESGAGKSTLAAAFHQAGSPSLADDGVWLKESAQGLLAVPCYPGLRLWEDSLLELFSREEKTQPMAHYSAKKRIAVENKAPAHLRAGAPVRALIALAPPEQITSQDIELHPLPPREAYLAAAKQTFLLDLDDRAHITTILQALGRIVPGMAAWRLSLPRDYAALPAARDMLLRKV